MAISSAILLLARPPRLPILARKVQWNAKNHVVLVWDYSHQYSQTDIFGSGPCGKECRRYSQATRLAHLYEMHCAELESLHPRLTTAECPEDVTSCLKSGSAIPDLDPLTTERDSSTDPTFRSRFCKALCLQAIATAGSVSSTIICILNWWRRSFGRDKDEPYMDQALRGRLWICLSFILAGKARMYWSIWLSLLVFAL